MITAEEDEFPEGYAMSRRRRAWRTTFSVPLLREVKPSDALHPAHRSSALHPQANRAGQMFADQAVIAIENARLFAEVHARTKELTSRWSSRRRRRRCSGHQLRHRANLARCLRRFLENATRICEAKFGILLYTGRRSETLRFTTHHLR